MAEVKYTDPQTLLDKIDYEGPEGITWFTGDEFEDNELAQLVEDANYHYKEYEDAIYAIEKRVTELNGQTKEG